MTSPTPTRSPAPTRETTPLPPDPDSISSPPNQATQGQSQTSRGGGATDRPRPTHRRSTRRCSAAPPPPPLPEGTPLARAASSTSTHAGNSLRRMATHETGELADVDNDDGAGLDTHHEHEHEHEHERDHGHEHVPRRSLSRHSRRSRRSRRSREDEDEGDRVAVLEVPDEGEDDTPRRKLDDEEAVGGNPDETDKKQKKEFELQDQTNLLPVRQVIMIFMGLNAALFCSLLDQTIVTTALPTLGRVFNASSIATWVGTAYMLTSTALQPVYGRLSDIFGRKKVLLASLTIFLLGSLACALARTMIQLIVFRAIQGLGGGGILTLSMIIISDVVSLKERGKYQGITGGVVAAANSLGPVLGGIFTEKVTWRWCFYISLPLTGGAILVILFLLPLKPVHGSVKSKLKKLDYMGSLLTLAWAVLVLLALSWSGSMYPWSSAAVIAPLVIGICLLFVFIFVEAKLVSLPLVPIYIFRNVTVAANMATTFMNGAAFYATLYYLPQYFQVVRGESPIQSGVDMLPLTFVQVFCSFGSGVIVSKTGDYKWNLMAGFFIWTIGLGMMSTMGPTTPKAHIYGFQVLVGVGAGQTFQTSLIAIQACVARKDMATATGCRNFLRMLGGTISLAACAAIVNNVAKQRLGRLGLGDELVDKIIQAPTELVQLGLDEAQIAAVRQVYAKCVDACFYLCVPMAGMSFFVTVFFCKRVPLKRGDEAQLKAEAKAWVEERKNKGSKGGKGDSHDGHASAKTSAEHGPSDSSYRGEDDEKTTPASEKTLIDDDVADDTELKKTKSRTQEAVELAEEAAAEMAQASGVTPDRRVLT